MTKAVSLRAALVGGTALLAVTNTPALAETPNPAGDPIITVSAPLDTDDAVTGDAAAAAPAEDAAPPREWEPLQFNRFGQELTSRWIPVPNGSSGAPRQGWLATADGFFTREAHVAYDYVDGRGFDRHEVLARFNYPWSRRFWTGVEIPFFQQSGRTNRNFGDVTISTLFMLHETRNVSINAGVGWRLPTGTVQLGNQVFAPTPQINFWSDIGHGFSLRGRIGYEIPNRGLPDTFVLNATIGQTVTPHNRAPLGDLTWYVAANWREPVSGPGGNTFVSITPGLRTHLGGNLFLLGGVEFPVTPQRNSFNERYIFQLVQGF